ARGGTQPDHRLFRWPVVESQRGKEAHMEGRGLSSAGIFHKRPGRHPQSASAPSTWTPSSRRSSARSPSAERSRNYVCVTGVHGVLKCSRDPALRKIRNEAGMVTPDGVPLVYFLRLTGKKRTQGVCGPDLMR